MSFIYHTFFFNPLYNALVLLFKLLPWADAGLIVIILTLLVRLVLFPLSKKAAVTQMRMNEIAPQIKEINETYKNNAEEKTRRTLALYQEKNINPFSGILVILIQLPLIFALYRIFLGFSTIRTDVLYSFIVAPAHINTVFLGVIDVGSKNLFLALLAAVTSYLQLHITTKLPSSNATRSGSETAAETLSRNMQGQMKYLFPVMIFFVAYKVAAVIALYLLTTNIFSIFQELAIRRKPLA